jgi:phenylalanyl-tRNA synthetase beta chain
MKVSYNWLKEFVDCDLAPHDLSHLLTMLGLEVDAIEHTGEGMDDVVVAQVVERAQHPNADKLSLCKVNNGKETLNIVCGAQNFKTGDKVVLAQIGAVLPGDFKIKRSKIRGEESFGMLCSEKELGLAEESAGIMILDESLPLGTPVFQALGLKDTIFEIGLTPNRADCLSIIGVAREIAAKLGKRVKYSHPSVTEKGPDIVTIASVRIDDADLCPRYTARYIANCTIKPSPQWLVNRLRALGQRSINNVVDVTNYVLLEYGHPLHAFDFRQLSGGQIIVRRSGEGEKFTTLDGQERSLKESDLTIRDAERAVALAGIMGGENSEIADDTTNILLESAYFTPSAIRLTSKRLGLHTESSHRFERGTDINIVTVALDRAAQLIAELADGTVYRGIIDAYPTELPHRAVTVRVDRVNGMLGLDLDEEQIASIFTNLEFDVERLGDGLLKVAIPSFRVDIEREIDLVEEVARLHGFENIPTTMPIAQVFSDRIPRNQQLERELKNLLVGSGFNEVINFSFASLSDLCKLNLPETDRRSAAVALLNPLVDEHAVMRTTLLPALLQTTARNFSMRNFNLRLFEMRRVYWRTPGKELPEEPLHVAGILSGMLSPEGWNQAKDLVDFFDVKGVVENIATMFNLPELTFMQGGVEPFYHPGKAAAILCGSELIGTIGEIHPDVQDAFELEKTVYYFELDFAKLVQLSSATVKIIAPSRFPDTYRDIAMLVAEETTAASIVDCIKAIKIDKLRTVEIFDVYIGDKIPHGQKSVAVRLRYGSSDKTLTDDEVNKFQQKVLNALTAQLEITQR